MSIEESIKVLDEIAEGFENLSAEVCARNDLRALWAGRAKGIRQAISVINAHLRVQTNNPLTLEELRGLEGESVWVEIIGYIGVRDGNYALVKGFDDEYVYLPSIDDPDDLASIDLYGEDWIAYRRRPEET